MWFKWKFGYFCWSLYANREVRDSHVWRRIAGPLMIRTGRNLDIAEDTLSTREADSLDTWLSEREGTVEFDRELLPAPWIVFDGEGEIIGTGRDYYSAISTARALERQGM